MSPKVFRTAADVREYSRQCRKEGKRIGLVPTMGCIHEGHLSLVDAAKVNCDVVIASIYVNPTQFSKNEDFGIYPRKLEEDIEKLAGCSAIFAPESLYHKPQDARDTDAAMVVDSHKTIDLDAHCTWVAVENLSRGLCAGSRPHFFRGVCTIVCKLFNIVDPDMAFFGKKDYQQWRVLERMARDLDFDIEIVGVPIFREPDGLAMSSRNLLLTSENRQNALSIYRALSKAKTNRTSIRDISVSKIKEEVAMEIIAAGGRIDYVEVVNSKSLAPVNSVVESDQPVLVAVAAFFGSVRLIDNIEI